MTVPEVLLPLIAARFAWYIVLSAARAGLVESARAPKAKTGAIRKADFFMTLFPPLTLNAPLVGAPMTLTPAIRCALHHGLVTIWRNSDSRRWREGLFGPAGQHRCGQLVSERATLDLVRSQRLRQGRRVHSQHEIVLNEDRGRWSLEG